MPYWLSESTSLVPCLSPSTLSLSLSLLSGAYAFILSSCFYLNRSICHRSFSLSSSSSLFYSLSLYIHVQIKFNVGVSAWERGIDERLSHCGNVVKVDTLRLFLSFLIISYYRFALHFVGFFCVYFSYLSYHMQKLENAHISISV